MTETDYRATSLWRSAFASRKGDKYKIYRTNLARAYDDLRAAAKPLLEQTARTLPQLTDHSGFHVDQLWEVASVLCGEGFEINPLEAFILGAAFAFHDAALTIEAYDGELDGLKKTLAWRDALYRSWQAHDVHEPTDDQLNAPPVNIHNLALFTVLRVEHARQAESLPFKTWKHPSTKGDLAFFADPKLRDDYGHWIGLVAASHHWPISQVADRLDRKLPHPSGYPVDWAADLLKIACILRCADAAAIDDRRAPARLFAIRQPTGTSRLHWAFQDNLFPLLAEGETITFKSKRPFTRRQMEEWWLAYDAISIAAEELQASNETLTTRGRATFQAHQIRGANNPAVLQHFVEVQDWEPVDTHVRIPNVTSLVERLGGSQLYGDDPFVPIRELVQNGCDAVRARRARATQTGDDKAFEIGPLNRYPGRVLLKFALMPNENDKLALTIEDDGIGLPPQAITAALLSFGTSFWKTELAAQLYPGLQSDPNFRPSGRFGLGFFSVFMLSSEVVVTSRPWSSGEIERKTLSFAHGVKGRAELRQFNSQADKVPDIGSTTTIHTSISLSSLTRGLTELSEKTLADLSKDYLSALRAAIESRLKQRFFALNVEIRLIWLGENTTLNTPYYRDWSSTEFARRFMLIFGRGQKRLSNKTAGLFQDLTDDRQRFYGKSAVCLNRNVSLGFHAIDGFIEPNSRTSGFVGIWEGTPDSVTRKSVKDPPRTVLEEWAEKQLNILKTRNLDLGERILVVTALADYGVNLLELAAAHMNGALSTLDNVVREVIKKKKMIFVLIERMNKGKATRRIPDKISIYRPIAIALGEAFSHLLHEVREVVYNSKTPTITSDPVRVAGTYYELETDLKSPIKLNTLYGCLVTKLNAAGYGIASIEIDKKYDVGTLKVKRGKETSEFELRCEVAKLIVTEIKGHPPS